MAGIYIHIPFCRHKCSYCDFTSFPDKIEYAEAYMACLYKELKMRGDELKDYEFDTVYFGGGTPSFFGARGMIKILNTLRKYFDVDSKAEITFEANPDSVTPRLLRKLRREGFNRVSLGIQQGLTVQSIQLQLMAAQENK